MDVGEFFTEHVGVLCGWQGKVVALTEGILIISDTSLAKIVNAKHATHKMLTYTTFLELPRPMKPVL
jgi:hypothetical protein